ncbi:hypothetical protein P3X46_022032 [Hevea brasiliensis]|uniref:Protein kinase domain-containing protein n=1 Tax=Hevea brasiliensis TaxID=3981 RepID=A0ABQ9LIM5_HEVBR|nr:hypothetical protein P3X46_022032 [Hevea brasiliensis]
MAFSKPSFYTLVHPQVFLFFFINLGCLQASASVRETDELALLEFKQGISDPHGIFNSWNDSLHFCNWTGITCGRRHQRVISLVLEGQNLFGSISPHIGNLSFLRLINLQNNTFHGEIPQQVGKLFRLQEFLLGNNSLQGEIPLNLSRCSQLKMIYLQSNNLTGKIPAELGSLMKLEIIELRYNYLTGEIPRSLGNLSSLTIFSALNNNLEGSIPNEMGQLKSLKHVIVGGNRLSGIISPSLFNITSLSTLGVASNQLNGSLPDNICFTLPNLQTFAFGENYFSGPVPNSLSNASHLEAFDISDNNFVGQVPSNLEIYRPSVAPLEMNHLLKVSYKDLYQGTDGFSCSNLIGSGGFSSVYKGFLPQVQTPVAVKVLNLEQTGAIKSFMAECNSLGNIRHRNLVKLVTCCSSLDYKTNAFKALIFEYMGNGSLEKWLHPCAEGENQKRSLNLLQRLNIAIDVASALHYLHDLCGKPIIHCDLKPSNVLLDDEMVAHVSDFGLAKLFSINSNLSLSQISTTRINGTVGYVAPEYGMSGIASKEGDVYSYGILVLEMFSERRPTDEMFKEGINLHNFVKAALPKRLLQIVDPTLLPKEIANEECDDDATMEVTTNLRQCLVSMLEIGVACSMESPMERMNMADVMNKLHLIKKTFLNIQMEGD